jgi:hypothetical protein
MRRGRDRLGTPTGRPVPQAIDPASGFKVPLSNLVRQWDNEMVDRRFVDKRNPQDFVRGVKDDMSLPYARPESPNSFVAINIAWESGAIMTSQTGEVLLTEGINPSETL